MESALLLSSTGFAALLLLGLALRRYAKRRLFLDPINLFLLNASMYFIVQVPFVLVPGNLLLTTGLPLSALWGEIWFAFGMEVSHTFLAVLTFMFLVSSYSRRRMDGAVRAVLRASSFLFQGHRAYLAFMIPVAAILTLFVLKYGAALFLVDSLGGAAARTVILREAADFRFLFNFASTALAFLLFYLGLVAIGRYERGRYLSIVPVLAVFLAGAVAAFVVTGTRSFVLTPIMVVIQTAIMFSARHNRPAKVFGVGIVLILAASALNVLRHGGGDLMLFRILYKGDSFADFRDYVWALNRFLSGEQEFWLGRTYLASWLSFIPASISQFREEWAFGRAIMRVLGWSSSDHFGIRPGLTGGAFLNGGVPLVLVTALFRGVAVYLEQRVYQVLLERKAALFPKTLMFFVAQQLLFTGFFFLNSNSLWPLYVNLFIIVTGFLALPLLRLKSRVDNRQALSEFRAGVEPSPPPASRDG